MQPSPFSEAHLSAAPELEIRSWPMRNGGWSARLVAASAVAISMIAGIAASSFLVFLGVLVLLAATLWRLWVPVGYHFGPTGIVQTAWGRRRRISWSQLARYIERRRGVLLLPTASEAPIAAINGLYIPWGARREELLQLLDYYSSIPMNVQYETTIRGRREDA